MTGLNEFASEIHKGNKQRGFWENKDQNVGELLMLVTSELGEALEAHRKGNFAIVPAVFESKEHFKTHLKDTFQDEIADAFIRILDMSAGLGIDLEGHVNAKLKYNATRERLHVKSY